jgi:hypothetical protein
MKASLTIVGVAAAATLLSACGSVHAGATTTTSPQWKPVSSLELPAGPKSAAFDSAHGNLLIAYADVESGTPMLETWSPVTGASSQIKLPGSVAAWTSGGVSIDGGYAVAAWGQTVVRIDLASQATTLMSPPWTSVASADDPSVVTDVQTGSDGNVWMSVTGQNSLFGVNPKAGSWVHQTLPAGTFPSERTRLTVHGSQFIVNGLTAGSVTSQVASTSNVVALPAGSLPVSGESNLAVTKGVLSQVGQDGSLSTDVQSSGIDPSGGLATVDANGVVWTVARAPGRTFVSATDPAHGTTTSYDFPLVPVTVDHQGTVVSGSVWDPEIRAVVSGNGTVWLVTGNGTGGASPYAAVYQLG